ncbi:MAG: GNAT family N-acetyltransferase [Ignavibacteriales bacterium]|nr:GNAT family N-acetyltransferase [Ignavibacteriales bacterium]
MDKAISHNLRVIQSPAREPYRAEFPQYLTVEVLRDKWRLERVQNEWSHLVEKSGAHIFQSFDWQSLWWKHFGGFKVLHVLLFRHHGTLVGAAPFYIDHKTLLGIDIYARLRLVGSLDCEDGWGHERHSCPDSYLDILSLPEYEDDVVRTLVKYLQDHYDLYDEISLENIAEDSMVKRKLIPAFEDLQWRYRKYSGVPARQMELAESLDVFMQYLTTNERHQLQLARRAVTHWRLFSVETVESQRELSNIIPLLSRLHRYQSQKRGRFSAFRNTQFDAFVKDVFAASLKKGVLSLAVARRDEQPVAFHCGFFFNKRAYNYLTACDESMPTARRKAEQALLLSFIEQAVEKRFLCIYDVQPNEPCIQQASFSPGHTWNLVIPNPPRYADLRYKLFHAQSALASYRRRAISAFLGGWMLLREYLRNLARVAKNSRDEESETTEGSHMISERRMKTNPEFRVEVIHKDSEFLNVRAEWEELVEQSNVSIYQTFDWMWLWWKHFGKAHTLHIVLIRCGEKLVGIVPILLEVRRILGMPLYRKFKFIGSGVDLGTNGGMLADSGPSDYLDMIAMPGYESDCAREFLEYLQRNSSAWSSVEFVNVPERGPILSTLVPTFQTAGMKVKVVQTDVCPRIHVPASLEEYLQGLNSNTRHRLNQSRKTFLNDSQYLIETVDSTEKLASAFQDLMRLHQQRWNRLGYVGLFSNDRFLKFQEDFARALLEQKRLWFKSVVGNGSRIACRMGFVFKNRFYDYLTGFDDTAPTAKRRPGMALLLCMIEDASRLQDAVVDLLRGAETYKFELTSHAHHNHSVTILNPVAHYGIREMIYQLVKTLDAIKGRVLAEVSLLRVQYREHGMPVFLAHYVAFRFKRAMQKANDWLKSFRNGYREKKDHQKVHPILNRIQQLKRFPLVQKILRGLKRDKNLPLSRRLYKGLIFVRALVLAKVYLWKCDIVGKRARTRARPFIVNVGRIEIGDDFNINSRIVRCELATASGGLIRIGNEVGINFGTCVFAQKHVDIGDRVHVGPYAMILDTDFHTAAERYSAPKGEPIIIEDDVWIGGRVSVLKGTRIGKGSVIMVGSVVSGVIPPHVIAGGVPARVIRSLNSEENHRASPEKQLTQRTNHRITERVASVFRRTFQIQGQLDQSWGPARIAGWDSLGHLNMISEIEQEFGISLTEEDMMRLRSVKEVCAVVQEHIEAGKESNAPRT